jgi:hypothetical protein
MKTILLAFAGFALTAVAGNSPTPPEITLDAALRMTPARALIFRPERFAAGEKLRVTYLRRGLPTTKPGEVRSVMLVIYAAQPGNDGTHAVLTREVLTIPTAGSPVLALPEIEPFADFPTAIGADNRVGIIAVLIGLAQAERGGAYRTLAFPANDSALGDLVAADGSVRLLLPAVQKIREAAAR